MVGAVSSGRIRRPGGGAGVPARSPRHTSAPRAKLPLSIHVGSCPFSSFLYCPVGRGTASPGTRPTSPRARTRLFWFRRPYFSSCGNCSPSLVYPKQTAHLQYYGYTSPTGDECRAEPRELQLRSPRSFQRYVVDPYQLSGLSRFRRTTAPFNEPVAPGVVRRSPSLVYPKQAAHLQYYGYTFTLHIHAVRSSSMPARPSLDTSPDDPCALLRAACPVSDARQLVLYPTPW